MIQQQEPHRIRSSVYYYFFVQLNWLWVWINTIILIVLQSLKIYQFPAPNSAANFSIIAPFILFILEWTKLGFAKPGNTSEYTLYLFIALLVLIVCVLLEVYFVIWQPYLWSWELPLHIISFVFEGILFIFTILMLMVFMRRSR